MKIKVRVLPCGGTAEIEISDKASLGALKRTIAQECAIEMPPPKPTAKNTQ